MNKKELKAVWSLGVVFSCRMLGMFIVLPVLSTFGMNLRGSNASLIGLAIGSYGLTQAIFQIPFGLASDRFGRKPVIIFGLLVFSIGSAIAAATSNIWGIILGRSLQGSGAITSAIMALLSDLTQEHNRSKAMAFIGINFGITFAIAIVVGPAIAHAIGLNGIFWSITILALTSALITLLVVPKSSQKVHLESRIDYSLIPRIVSNSRLFELNIGIFFLHAMLMLLFVVLPSTMNEAGLLPKEQWKLYLITTLISFSLLVPITIYIELKHCTKQAFLACVSLLLIAEVTLIGSGRNLWIIFAGVQLFFLSFHIMETLIPSSISKKSPVYCRGTVMGIYSTSQFLGAAFGGIFGGVFFHLYGSWSVFLIGILLALVWLKIILKL